MAGRLRRWLRGLALTVLVVAVLPPVSEYFVVFFWGDSEQQEGLRAVPGQIVSWAGFWPLLALVAGAAGGLWADHILRRFDRAANSKRQRFAMSLKQFSNQIRTRVTDVVRRPRASIVVPIDQARLDSILLTLWEDYRIPPPSQIDSVENSFLRAATWMRYLHFVGTLLQNGHVKEARKWASEFQPSWTQDTTIQEMLEGFQ